MVSFFKLIILVSVLTLPVNSVFGGMPITWHLNEEQKIKEFFPTILSVEIIDSGNPTATNGSPPKLTIRVIEILKGEIPSDLNSAIWLPPEHGVDVLPDRTGKVARWAKKPLPPPSKNSTWIVSGRVNENVFQINSHCRYPFSIDKRNEIISLLKNPDVAISNNDFSVVVKNDHFKLHLRPGESGAFEFKVANNGKKVDSYRLTISEQPELITEKDFPKELTLNPGKWEKIKIKVNVPHNAEPGTEKYFYLSAESNSGTRAFDSASGKIVVK